MSTDPSGGPTAEAGGIPPGVGGLDATPLRLRRGLDGLARWGSRGVHFAPIRHHSPACALALRALLDEVRPGVVLVEGPQEYAAVLTALQDPRTVPPVAVLSVDGSRAAFYPLAEFSPEWVALRWAGEHADTVEFIDQSYRHATDDDDDPGARTLQEEHHLARSAAIAALAARLGCRDHDEVWEHLFEDRADDDLTRWRPFFADVLAWAALARLEASREALDSDGTHAREAVMAGVLARHVDGPTPVVVVTGAFHTLALLEVLEATPEAAWVLAHAAANAPESSTDACWLIRYDFTRLDALRGYGAGMPSPGFWQRAWAARLAGDGPRAFATSVVLDVVAGLRDAGEPLGTAQATSAAEQVLRLAQLRNRSWPGRADTLDGLLSTLAKDDTGMSGALGQAVAAVFASSAMGDVPPGLSSPPLVAKARGGASKRRFDVGDAQPKRISLDTERSPRHRSRREFLAMMRFIGSGFARQVGGADLVTGTGLGQFVEQWEYAWTPLVEMSLIEASTVGPTLDALVAARVRERLANPDATSEALTALVAELLVMGRSDHVPEVCRRLDPRLADSATLGSVVASLHGLVGLLAGGGRLDIGDLRPQLEGLVERGLATVAYLLPGLAGLDRADSGAAVEALIGLRDLIGRLDDPAGVAGVARELARLRHEPMAAPEIRGCLVGLAAVDGSLAPDQVTQLAAAHLAPGVDPEQVADFLLGLLRAAPDLVLHDPDLVATVSAALVALDEPDFLAILPDLRRAFTYLKPTETHRLAEQIARLTGVAAYEIDVVLRVDPELVETAHTIERDLVAGLIRDGLVDWVAS